MYILMERNRRGTLEVDDRIIDKIIEFIVINNTKGIDRFEIETSFNNDDQIFIIIKIYVSNRDKIEIEELKLNNLLVFAIENAVGMKPKNISFVYIKN